MRGRKPNFVACVHCRQMKLGCDLPSKFPAGCSRCTKAGKFCSVDPTFKRTKRRQRLQQVEEELREARNNLREQQKENIPDELQPSPLLTTDVDISVGGVSNQTQSIEGVVWPLSRSIGGVELTASQIQELVTEFYQFYHQSCAILPSSSSFIAYCDEYPILFWTVMFIAMRDRSDYKQLFLSLVDEIYAMAYACIRPINRSFHSIQALLLLCYWPPPFDLLSDDPSNAFINMAIDAGLRLGLHRPGYAKEFDRKIQIDEHMQILRQTTWVVCFITNVSVNGQTGLPPTVRLDRGLLDILATKPPWLPNTLYCQLQIARQSLNMFLTLGNCELSNTGLLPKPQPVVQLFETQLRDLELELSASWSQHDYVSFCACKTVLYVLALAAADSSDDESSMIENETRPQWVLQIYMVSMAMVQTVSSLQNQLLKTPTRVSKALAGAVAFLILLKCSKYHHLVVDSTLTDGIRQGWDLLGAAAITSDDFMTRVHLGLERLIKYSETLKPEDKTQELLSAKARMGYNVARSISLLLQGKVPRQAQDNTLPNDGVEMSTDGMINAEEANLFLDFDWDDSLLGLFT